MKSNTVNRTKHHQRIIDTIYRFLLAVSDERKSAAGS